MLNMVCNLRGHQDQKVSPSPRAGTVKLVLLTAHHHSGYHSGVTRAHTCTISPEQMQRTDAHVHMAVSTQQCTGSTTAAAISEQDPFSGLSLVA
jgi:hypothetical protein